jgi:large subunit ribosomal protein L28
LVNGRHTSECLASLNAGDDRRYLTLIYTNISPITVERAFPLAGFLCAKNSEEQKEYWGLVMAQVCEICGKGPQFGNNISHAHNVSRRRWNVNLRPVKAKVDGGQKRLRVCTSCIKAGKVVKA